MKIVRSIGKFFSYFLLCILIVFFVWFVSYLIIPTPQKTVRSFFTHIKLENYQKAYQLIDGKYLEKRGTLVNFSTEYKLAVESGTRTKKIVISGVEATKNPKQKIVSVVVSVLYIGSVVDTQGSYLVEKINGKGWRIVDNVTNQQNKKKTGNTTMLPKSNP